MASFHTDQTFAEVVMGLLSAFSLRSRRSFRLSTASRCLLSAAVAFGGMVSSGLAAEKVERLPAADIGLQLGPETTIITQPLTADGYPDFIAYINQRNGAGVEASQNFWAGAWVAMGNGERSSPEFIHEVERILGVQIGMEPKIRDLAVVAGVTGEAANALYELQSKTMSEPWKRADYPQVQAWLEANEAVMAGVTAAAKRPKAFSPAISSTNPALIGVLLPHIQKSREFARLLTARAMRSLGEGDSEAAWNDLMTVHRIARHVEKGWTLIEQLVAVAIRSIGQEGVAQWLVHSGATADQLQTKWEELAPLSSPRSFGDMMQTERLMYADTVMAMVSGSVKMQELTGMVGNGAIQQELSWSQSVSDRIAKGAEDTFSKLVAAATDVNVTLRYGNRMYDELSATMTPATHQERLQRIKAFEKHIEKEIGPIRGGAGSVLAEYFFSSREEAAEVPAKVLISLLIPAVTGCEKAQTSGEARAAVLETAFRIQQHLLKTDKLPASLDELADGKPVPADPFTGAPLKLKSDERGLVVYSVGRNEKDDAGKTFSDGQDLDDHRVVIIVP